MSVPKAAFVLIHGGWHNHAAWERVTTILEDRRPFGAAVYATERSPPADVTQEERTQAAVALIKEASSLNDDRVILVGHSAGGVQSLDERGSGVGLGP